MRSMTGRERLTAVLNGEAVDRPALNFYEIGGFEVDRHDPDPFNIYNSPSWETLLDLAETHSDVIRMRFPRLVHRSPVYDELCTVRKTMRGGSRFRHTTLSIGGRVLSSATRRDCDVDTVWTTEHLLKDEDDLKAYLALPEGFFEAEYSVDNLLEAERTTGDRGIVMADTGDPLVEAAGLFDFETYCVIAMTQPALFHQLIEKLAVPLYRRTEYVAKHFQGRLWRIFGPEYASEPYLPPKLFREFVVRYTEPMVRIIHKYGGKVRLHSHGRLKNILNMIVETGADAIDPIEPPPQGDVDLEYVAKNYGRDLTLFGNIEVSDIENLPPEQFRPIVRRSLEAGSAAKGFVLMPSASPYGRDVPETTIANYRIMVEEVAQFRR